MKKEYVFRGIIYVVGILVLAMGLTLNTKAGLGVSAIISVPYSISLIWNLNFGNMTLIVYALFVVIEMILHTIRNKRYAANGGTALENANRRNIKLTLLMDALQFPFSLVFTRFLNVFNDCIPNFRTDYPGTFIGSLGGSFLLLFLALVLTGVGAAMTLDMRIVPNPGDGIVQAIADCAGKSVGFTKNCFDLLNICITVSIGMIFAGKIVGAGIGTVFAVIAVGRVIAAFNHFFMPGLLKKAGLE